MMPYGSVSCGFARVGGGRCFDLQVWVTIMTDFAMITLSMLRVNMFTSFIYIFVALLGGSLHH